MASSGGGRLGSAPSIQGFSEHGRSVCSLPIDGLVPLSGAAGCSVKPTAKPVNFLTPSPRILHFERDSFRSRFLRWPQPRSSPFDASQRLWLYWRVFFFSEKIHIDAILPSQSRWNTLKLLLSSWLKSRGLISKGCSSRPTRLHNDWGHLHRGVVQRRCSWPVGWPNSWATRCWPAG